MTNPAPQRQTRQTRQPERRLTRQDVIAAVRAWQTSGQFHPLTCGYDSRHRPLEPKIEGPKSVVLICPDCDYVLAKVPDIVITAGPLLGKGKARPNDVVVPPIAGKFKDAATRLLKVKPKVKPKRKA